MRCFYTPPESGNGGSGLKCRNKAPMPDISFASFLIKNLVRTNCNMHMKALASPTLILNCRDSATR